MAITKTKEEEIVEQAEALVEERPLVHHMVRPLSRAGRDDVVHGYRSVATLDAEVDVWIRNGYKLLPIIYLGEAPEFYQLMYIFVLQE